MSYAYADKKRRNSPPERDAAPAQPSLDALRTGAAAPTAEQKGRRVDLPDAMREKMETAFGADLSAVKLYESEAVSEAGASAITQGSEIAFAPGMLDFSSFGGQSLLGHEISHVVSQARGEVTGGGFLNDRSLEARADREGAMAAAGQQVATVSAPLSGVSAAAAAGPMQAGRKDKSKKGSAPEAPASVPDNLSFDNITSLKPGNDDNSASVAKVGSAGGQDAVVKTGVDADLESAVAAFHNVAGQTFSANQNNMWSFNAPDARALTPQERAAAASKVGEGVEGQPTTLNSVRNKEARAASRHAAGDVDEVTDELNHMVAYSLVGGKSRLPAWDQASPVEREKLQKQGDSAITANPTDKKENADYQRMMGYIGLTDMITGNTDRITDVNYDNWMEERDKHQVHLIDNDFAQAQHGMHYGMEGRSNWLKEMKKYIGRGAAEEGSVGQRFVQSIVKRDQDRTGGWLTPLLGEHGGEGAQQAISDLPAMRERLTEQYKKSSPNGQFNEHQQEILDRMQMAHEYMAKPEMAAVYDKLADVGLTAQEGEDEQTTKDRTALMQILSAMRKQEELAKSGRK